MAIEWGSGLHAAVGRPVNSSAYAAGLVVGADVAPAVLQAAELPEPERQVVRAEVKAGLSRFASNGRLHISVEMLIGGGRA